MFKLKARELLNYTLDTIWSIQPGDYEVTYEDGETKTLRHKDLIFDRYCYDLLLVYPNTPITSVCTVRHILGTDYYNADTHVKYLEHLFQYVVGVHQLLSYRSKEALCKATLVITNNLLCDLTPKLSNYVTTIDAVDFIQAVNHEKIKEIHTNLQPNPSSVDSAYKAIKAMMTDKVPTKNRFIKAYRAKSINENQANQLIGPRGFISGADKTVYSTPVMNGFIRGMGSLYEEMAESTTAAKSLRAQDSSISMSEYASRRVQLHAMTVEFIEAIDCGSTRYMELPIAPNFLDNLKGIYYVTENNQLDYFRGNETHLVGKTVKIRTVLGCRHPNPSTVCSTCLGLVSTNFPENSNLGYTMTAFVMEKGTQTILSTKHLTHSVKKSMIRLEGNANKYFYASESSQIYLNRDIDTKGLILILPNSDMKRLVDVLSVQHSNVALNKIGELTEVAIRDMKPGTPVTATANISYKDRTSVISQSLLDYIKTIDLDSDARGNFLIPLDGFNKSKPLFTNPLRETNMITFVDRTTDLIEKMVDKVTDPYERLYMLFTHVISQFKCNLSALQVLIYATTSYNKYNDDYRLARNSDHSECAEAVKIFRHRSIPQLLVYQNQIAELTNYPDIMFSKKNRCSHPMDVLFSRIPR